MAGWMDMDGWMAGLMVGWMKEEEEDGWRRRMDEGGGIWMKEDEEGHG
jgi:hypothetical protein